MASADMFPDRQYTASGVSRSAGRSFEVAIWSNGIARSVPRLVPSSGVCTLIVTTPGASIRSANADIAAARR